jgi:ABC-2 type transport system ATP-binding protein
VKPLADLHNIRRSFGSVVALRDVSLLLQPGTIGLVGNNGAGKSTLLKILLGLLAPDGGGGTILGCDILQASQQLRGQVGYMPESAAIVPVLRGVEFVTLSGDLYGMPHRDARRRAHEVLNYVGLGELRYRRLEEYSAGNIQRLKLAAALVHDPRLLLLDEPTNGLDPAGRIAMLRLIEDLIAESGKSVILCTHLLGDVERLCQQIVVLHQGSVVTSGTISQLRAKFDNRFDITWVGADLPFREALQNAGLDVTGNGESHQARVALPRNWPTSRLFELARDTGVVLTRLTPEEEDLLGMFFRVTDNATEEASPRQESAHGD